MQWPCACIARFVCKQAYATLFCIVQIMPCYAVPRQAAV
jgi:hypothetical protein